MSKIAARKLHKRFRRETPGLPFILSVKLAKLVEGGKHSLEIMEKLPEFSPEYCISCTCCGLPYITFTTKAGKFTYDVFGRKFQ